MAIEKIVNITVNKDQAEASIKSLNNEIKKTQQTANDSKQAIGSITDSLDKLTGGAVSSFKSLSNGLTSAVSGFKAIGSAITLSGLGLLVIIIGGIVSAFKQSEEGQDKFAKGMAIIGAVTDGLIDLLASFGELIMKVFENPKKAITDLANLIKDNIVNRFTGLLELIPQLGKALKQLFSGEFSKAAETAANAAGKVALGVENVTGKVKNAINATKEFTLQLQRQAKIAGEIADKRDKADDLERDLIVKRAKADREVAELREKVAERSLYSLKERIGFLKQASAIEDAISAQERKASALKLQAQIDENNNSKKITEEQKIRAQELTAELIKIDTARAQAQKSLKRQIETLNAQEIADQEAKNKQLSELDQQRYNEQQALLKKQNEEELKNADEFFKALDDAKKVNADLSKSQEEIELEAIQEKYKKQLEFAEQFGYDRTELEIAMANELNDVNLKYQNQRYENDKKASEAEKQNAEALKNAKVAFAGQTLDLIAQLAGKGTSIAKGIAVAQATMSGIEGVQNAYSTAQKSPITTFFPAYPLVQAGIAGAFSALQIKKILSTKVGASTSSSGGDSGGGSVPSAPSFNVVAGTGSNQIAEGLATERQPVKAYVVASEMTSQQSLDRNIQTSASI